MTQFWENEPSWPEDVKTRVGFEVFKIGIFSWNTLEFDFFGFADDFEYVWVQRLMISDEFGLMHFVVECD